MPTPLYTDDQWSRARHLYTHTRLSIRAIGQQTGIKDDAIESTARRREWRRAHVDPSPAVSSRLGAKLDAKLELKANALAEKASEFRERAVNASFRLVNVLEKLCDKLEADGLDPASLADCAQKAASAHNALTNAAWKQLGLDQQRAPVRVGLFLPVEVFTPPVEPPAIEVLSISGTAEKPPQDTPANTSPVPPAESGSARPDP